MLVVEGTFFSEFRFLKFLHGVNDNVKKLALI